MFDMTAVIQSFMLNILLRGNLVLVMKGQTTSQNGLCYVTFDRMLNNGVITVDTCTSNSIMNLYPQWQSELFMLFLTFLCKTGFYLTTNKLA